MKRFQAMAQRITAFVLSAGMMASAAAPTVLAAQQAPSAPLGAENSVDELGNEDVSDETFHEPDDRGLAADAEFFYGEADDDIDLDDLTEEQLAEQAAVDESGHKKHTPDTDDLVYEQPSTCAQRGYAIYRCSFELEQEDGTVAHCYHWVVVWLSLTDHEWGEWQEPDDADSQKYRVCSVCNAVEYEDDTAVTPDGVPVTDPDHPEWLPGDIGVGGNYDDQIELARGHTHSKNFLLETIEATCTEPKKRKWKCWCTFNFWDTQGEKLGHMPEQDAQTYTKPATCTEDGVTYKYCGRNNNGTTCMYEYPNTRQTLFATGHHTGDEDDAHKWVKGDGTDVGWTEEPATCTTAGKRYRRCDTCQKEEVDNTYADAHPATGHITDGVKWTKDDGSEIGWVVNQPYKCADGTKTRECDVCHEKETVTVPATEEHQRTDWIVTVEPTCTTTGTRVKKCTVCGNVVETETINALEHDFQNYVDDNRPACCDQYETGTCTRCDAKDTRKTSDPIRAHKFTRYIFGTFDGRLATRADCDYKGCTAYDDKAFSLDNYKENGYVLAATEASETIADYAEEVIKQAMRDAETAVANASTREEAIASLDVIVASVRSQLLNKKVSGEVRMDPGWGAWAIVKIPYSVTITKEMVGSMLTDLQNGMNSVKEMLGSSFLSKDAIQTLIGKVEDTVAKSDDINYSMRWIVYPEAYYQITAALNGGNGSYPGGDSDKAGEKATISNLILQLAGDLVQKDPNSETDAVQEFVSAIFDDLIDMLIEELKKDETYGKYLNNALGDELLAELRPKLREELVNDTAFVDTIRGIVQIALSNAAAGVNKGWKEKAILAQLREDLLKVQDPVEQEMIKLSGIIGDLVESSLAEKINKLLPFGDLTSWIGKWVGEFAKDKAVSEVVGETGRVRDTIELYIKYITCPGHDYHYITTRATTCTEDGEEKLKCSKCGWVRSDNKITHEKLGHVPVVDEAVDPTETEEGLTEGSHCARCGAVLEAQEVIPALQPQMDAKLVCSAIPEEAVTAMRYENRKKLDAAMDAALTKAGYTAADSQRFLAQVNSSIGILPSDRYPEEGFTGYVPRPAQTAADKKYTWYAVQLLTVDAHGHNAGDVIITPVTQTDKGLQLTVYAQAVVALAWKEAK